MGEGYRNIRPEQLPPLVQFGEPRPPVGQLQATFSVDKGGDWGAAYRRLVHLKTGKVQYSRYYSGPDAETDQERGRGGQ
jgi:hypothetical protein